MPEDGPEIVLIAQPCRMRASLPVLLKSLFPTILIDFCEDHHDLEQLLSTRRFSLILIDADLPDDQGWKMAEKFTRLIPERQVLLLVHLPSQVDRALSMGVNSLLVEGISSQTLSNTIEEILRKYV